MRLAVSAKATNWAMGLFEFLDIPPAERAVLVYLCWYHNAKTDDCTPAQSQIAKITGYRRQRVSQAIGSLERMGLIRRAKERRVGKFDSCNYRLFGSFNGRSVSVRGDTVKRSTVYAAGDTVTVSGRGDTIRGNTNRGGGEKIIDLSQKKMGRA